MKFDEQKAVQLAASLGFPYNNPGWWFPGGTRWVTDKELLAYFLSPDGTVAGLKWLKAARGLALTLTTDPDTGWRMAWGWAWNTGDIERIEEAVALAWWQVATGGKDA